MPRRPRRFYALATLVYLAVVVALVALALFGRGTTERLGEVKVAVRYRPWPLLGSAVQRATVSFRGLRLSFDRDHPISLGESSAGLEEVREVSTGVDLGFGGEVRLELRRSDDGYSISLAGAPAAAAGALTVPFRAPGVTLASGGVPALGWTRGGQACYVSLPPGSVIDPALGELRLDFESAGDQGLRFGASGGSAQVLAARWLSDQASLVDDAGWDRALAAFRDAAWQGWTRDRVSADGTLWKAADGSWSFFEAIGPAMLAESLARGRYLEERPVAIAAMARQLNQAADPAWTLSASAYLGWLPLYEQRMQAREAGALARIKDGVAAADPEVFSTPSVALYVLDHGVLADLQSLMSLAGGLDPATLDAACALGALEAWLDYASQVDDSDRSVAAIQAIVEQRIVPSIRKTDRGLYFTVAADRVDTARSIACGQILGRAGGLLGDKRLAAIGRTLVASSIGLVRAGGFLPQALRLAGGRIAAQEGSLAPEAVYDRVGDDRYLPHEVPLYRTVGPGAWIWTAARVSGVDATPAQLRFTVAFPSGQPHYLVVAGLRPFKEVQLHGEHWPGDPAFAQGADGWSWDGDRQLLSIKLTGRADSEQVVIAF